MIDQFQTKYREERLGICSLSRGRPLLTHVVVVRTRLAVTGALGLGVLASIIQGYKLSIMGASFKYTDEDPTCTFSFFPLPLVSPQTSH